ncbi:hypothetical protein SETIT_5G054200v2 [Setaria italica]|uniref:Uncharacterized protein n=1 Tax=Setaria italica TaxID=4555 RepID=A0A368R1Q1_SETIT|nr:hypothetical protein SETIT_5G054200v2 [Setaria italica]
MAGQDGGGDLHVRVVSRSFVRASSASIVPHVLAVSNLDLAIRCGNQGAEFVVGEASVALASLALDHGASLRRIQLPYGEELALSVQVVSFACGGFTVAWRTNHVMVDGSALSRLVSSWSELARSGTLPAGARPSHDRRELRPRAAPSYSAALDDELTPLDARCQINALTTEQSFVRRLYFIEASDMERLRHAASCPGTGHRATRVQAVSAYLWKALAGAVGTADTHCRMGWWVNRRQRIAAPALRAAVRNYAGNFTTFTELVDWVEEHKTWHYIKTASAAHSFASFPIDTDFGFGRAVIALPVSVPTARLCSGYVEIIARPGGDGSWIASAFLWPRLAAALEADEQRVFRPVTAETLVWLLLESFAVDCKRCCAHY